MVDSSYNHSIYSVIPCHFEGVDSDSDPISPAMSKESMAALPKLISKPPIHHPTSFIPYYPYPLSEANATVFTKTWTITPTDSITNTNETISYTHLHHIRPDAPLAPSNFVGIYKKHKIQNHFEYLLEATWRASRSPDVMLYRVFENGRLVEEVPTGSALIYIKPAVSKDAVHRFTVVAVNKNNIESLPTIMRIIPI